jgi:hypothetical protein
MTLPCPCAGNDREVRANGLPVTLIRGGHRSEPFMRGRIMLHSKDSDRMPGLTMLHGGSNTTKMSNLDFRTLRVALCLFLVLFPLSLFAAGHDVSAVRYAPANLYIRSPRVAANGGRLLTVWAMGDLAYGALAETGNGAPSMPFLLPGVTGSPSPLAPWGGGFIGLWWSGNYYDIVTLRGNGSVEQVSRVTQVSGPPRFATNGRQLLVADLRTSSSSGTAYATLYEPDGTLLAQTNLSAPSVAYVDVARAGNSYVVITAGWGGEVHFYRFDDAGALIADRELQPKPPPYAGRAPLIAVAGDAAHTVVAWTRTESSAAYVTSVSSNNDVGALQPLPIKSAYGKICVVPTASCYLILWSEDRAVAGVRTTAAGQLIDGTAIPIAPGYLQEATAAGDQFALVTTPPDGSETPLSMVSGTLLPQGVSASVSEIVTSAAARQEQPVIASDGVDYVAAWLEHNGPDMIAMVGRVTRAGVPLDGPGVTLPVPTKKVLNVSIARGTGGDALVVVGAVEGTWAFRWSRIVGLVDKSPIVLDGFGANYGTAVAWNGVSYLVLRASFYTSSSLAGWFVDSNGSAGAKFDIPMTLYDRESAGAIHPAIAWDGRQFLISIPTAYNGPCTTLCPSPYAYEIRLVRLSAAGSVLDKTPYRVLNAVAARIATSGREFLLLSSDYYSFSTAIVHGDASGLSVTAPIITVQDVRASDVTWDGTYYDVAWTGIGDFLRLWRVDRTGHVQQKVFVAGPDGAPSVAANDAGEVAIGVAEAAPPSNLSRARIYFNSELQPVPTALPTPTNATGHLIPRNEALLHWDGDAPGYLVEWLFNDVWHELQHLPGNVHEATVYAQPGFMYRIRAYGPDGSAPDGAFVTVHSEPRTRTVRR